MEFINVKCKKCGNIKQISESERSIYMYGQDKEQCFICSGEYEIIENNKLNRDTPYRTPKAEETTIDELVHLDLIEGMKKNISVLGNDKVYDIIEKFKIPGMRLAHRKLFLEAGGEFPITEIKI